jgi:hypothetical protein
MVKYSAPAHLTASVQSRVGVVMSPPIVWHRHFTAFKTLLEALFVSKSRRVYNFPNCVVDVWFFVGHMQKELVNCRCLTPIILSSIKDNIHTFGVSRC